MEDKNLKLTEHELENNIEYHCKECSEEKLKNWQKNNSNQKIKIGDFVKIACKDDGEVEHMWFKIVEIISKKKFKGKLNNMPLFVYNIKMGDIINIKFKEIEEYLENEK